MSLDLPFGFFLKITGGNISERVQTAHRSLDPMARHLPTGFDWSSANAPVDMSLGSSAESKTYWIMCVSAMLDWTLWLL